jgi:hypothetical protein
MTTKEVIDAVQWMVKEFGLETTMVNLIEALVDHGTPEALEHVSHLSLALAKLRNAEK